MRRPDTRCWTPLSTESRSGLRGGQLRRALLSLFELGRARARSGLHPRRRAPRRARRCIRPSPASPSSRSVADHYRSLTWTYERAALARHDADVVLVPSQRRAAPICGGRSASGRAAVPRARAALWRGSATGCRSLCRTRRRSRAPLAAPARLRAAARAEARADLPGPRPAQRPRRGGRERRRGAPPLAVPRGGGGACASPRTAVRRCRWASSAPSAASTRYEGAWTSNTGNGYYGGLQMDVCLPAALRRRVPRALGDGRQLARLGAARGGGHAPTAPAAGSGRGRTPRASAA